MKVFVVVLALVGCVLAEELPAEVEKVMKIVNECYEEHHITNDMWNKMLTSDTSDQAPIRKFILCMAERSGAYSHQKGFDADIIAIFFHNFVEREEAKKAAEDCIAKPMGQKSDEDYVFEVYNCVMAGPIGKKIESSINK